MKTIYVVMRADKSIIVNGVTTRLPEGNFLMPCFDTYDKAKEAAGDRFEIIEMSTNE